MRRVLALAVLVAALPTANAQDKAKSDFSHNAEYRARYFWHQNPSANKTNQGSDNDAYHRFKLGSSFRANEKFTANLTLLHAAEFGQGNTETLGNSGAPTGSSTTNTQEENFLSVNEAYMGWMTSDDLNFKIGRMNYQIADGTVIAVNDWEQQPVFFEGVLANWEAEWGRIQGFLFKYRELTGTSSSADPGHSAYGLNFDLKTMPEWLKAVNVHVIKDAADAIEGQTGTTVSGNNGQDGLRYGLMAGFGFGLIDFKAWYNAHNTKYKNIAVGGAKTEVDGKGHMYQAELGFNMANFMNSRIFLKYHVDTGDKDTATGDAETYDPYFTERHASAGHMDLLAWGNLTFATLGWTMTPMDGTNVGLQYWMFTRTEKGAASAGLNRGSSGALPLADNTKDDLGQEIDLWAEHKYDGGLATVLRLGYFMPGDAVEGTGANKNDDAIMQVMLEGKVNF